MLLSVRPHLVIDVKAKKLSSPPYEFQFVWIGHVFCAAPEALSQPIVKLGDVPIPLLAIKRVRKGGPQIMQPFQAKHVVVADY